MRANLCRRWLSRIVAIALIIAICGLPLSAEWRLECTAIKQGQMVDVEMRDGSHVVGPVRAVGEENITIDQLPGPQAVIDFHDIVAVRDVNGAIIAVPLPRAPVKTVPKRLVLERLAAGAFIAWAVFAVIWSRTHR